MEQKITAYRSLMERDCLQNLVVDGRINLKLIFKNGMGEGGGGVHWSNLAQERGKWCGL
jgi:hypothetical protein